MVNPKASPRKDTSLPRLSCLLHLDLRATPSQLRQHRLAIVVPTTRRCPRAPSVTQKAELLSGLAQTQWLAPMVRLLFLTTGSLLAPRLWVRRDGGVFSPAFQDAPQCPMVPMELLEAPRFRPRTPMASSPALIVPRPIFTRSILNATC